MKKLLLTFMVLTFCLSSCIIAFADNNINTESGSIIEAPDLRFTPAGGGKFIYCNNEEGIGRHVLADSSNPNPIYTMNNENLTPDRYLVYLTHINYTYSIDEYYQPNGMGFNIELDMEIKAKEDSVLTINNAVFETPKIRRYYDNNGDIKVAFSDWGAMNACASLLGKPIYQLHSSSVFKPSSYKPVTVHIKKGETVWLSQYVNNYASTAFMEPVFMAADMQLVSGKLDMNVVKLKSNDKIGDRSYFNCEGVAFGSYQRDRCQKGIADTLPEVNTELKYTIDDSVETGTNLPVKIYNQYVDGEAVDMWCTNLNPQDDIWSKYIAAESDILTFKYYDPSKLSYYGKNVPASKRDAVWVFDTKHSDTSSYLSETGLSPDNYSPNFILDPGRDNYGIGCSIGNYGVTTKYNLKVTNAGNRTRYFNYNLLTSGNVIAYARDKNGKLTDEVHSKGITDEQTTDTMACVELPPNQTTQFSIEVILPVNYLAGLKNSFTITDTKSEFDLKTEKKAPAPDYVTILSDYMDEYNNANDYTKEFFAGNLNNFEVTETDYGYMLRWCAWDDQPGYQARFFSLMSYIYFLDKDFNMAGSQKFSTFPAECSAGNGKMVVKTIDGTKKFTTDGVNWASVYWSEDSNFEDVILVKLNGEYLKFDQLPIIENDRTLVPMRFIFEKLGMTVEWDDLTQTASAKKINGKNNSFEIKFTIGSDTAFVNGTVQTMDVGPKILGDRTLIPLRFLSENLGYIVDWEEISQTVTISEMPVLPNVTQKYYVIYREGYRDGRIEVSFFDTSDGSVPELVWDRESGNLELSDNTKYSNDSKWYLDKNTWQSFEGGYERPSNNALQILRSNIKIVAKDTIDSDVNNNRSEE